LARISAKHPGVALLRTIPGVGLRTAEAFVAFVDDPNRFKPKSIGAYFGIVPRQDASSDRNRLGRITKDGTAIVRGLLTEAAWQGIRRSASIRAVFERISGGDPDRKKRAIVATGHYLCRVMLGMLRTGEAWNPRTA
jgi:transposase